MFDTRGGINYNFDMTRFEQRPLREVIAQIDTLAKKRQEWKTNASNTFGTARASLSMSQGEFARALGVSQAYVSLVESGERTPSTKSLTTLEELLKEENV